MTDNLQPLPLHSEQARKPADDPKGDKRRYFMLTHGSHLIDLVRFLGGPLAAVRGRCREMFGAYSWFVEVEFANGGQGHLDLTRSPCAWTTTRAFTSTASTAASSAKPTCRGF